MTWVWLVLIVVGGLLALQLSNTRAELLVLIELMLGGEGHRPTLGDRIRVTTGRILWTGTLYAALRGLEERGLVESFQQPDLTGIRGGRPRRVYRITYAGRAIARAWLERNP